MTSYTLSYLSLGASGYYSVTTAIKRGHDIQLWLRGRESESALMKGRQAVEVRGHYLSIRGQRCVLVLSNLPPHHNRGVAHRTDQEHISSEKEGEVGR